MELSEKDKIRYTRRILIARMRILAKNGFYGLLLMHTKFALDESVETAATDGNKIIFAPSFMDRLTDIELVFVLHHEIMHIVLRHISRTGTRDKFLFNVACDIVVNSNILYANGNDLSSITIGAEGASMHKAPDGCEGYHYTAEEVYDMLIHEGKDADGYILTDNHSKWGEIRDDCTDALWTEWIRDAYEAAMRRKTDLPAGVERTLKDLLTPKIDWRELLHDFIQEEITDYTFAPLDRRYAETGFFLPDYNDRDTVMKKIVFWIDTSGSITDDEIREAYSEIAGAIEQFNGKMDGMLGFFDAAVYPPVPFISERDLMSIKPIGAGGTDFYVLFNYMNEYMADEEIASIIILTDGIAEFPPETAANGIPVLWIMNNDLRTPPWGRSVVIV